MGASDAQEFADLVSKTAGSFIACGFSFGLIAGTVLEFLMYGVFKALSLLNIK